MNTGFIRTGKVGLPIALAIESKGHRVVAHDPADGPQRILHTRRLIYREADAQPLSERRRIEILPLEEFVERSEIIFVTVQTPHEPRFEGVIRLSSDTRDFDYRHLCTGVTQLSAAVEVLGRERIVIIVSIVLPGAMRREINPRLGPHPQTNLAPIAACWLVHYVVQYGDTRG